MSILYKSFLFECVYLLLENQKKIDFISAQNPHIDSTHDTLAQHRDSSAIVKHFADHADPTENKDYLHWIVNNYKKKNFRQEDHARIKSTLQNFHQYKNRLEKKDINGYKSLSEIQDAVEPYVGFASSNKESKSNKKVEGADLLFSKNGVTVHHVKTKAAACRYGSGTQWCTAADENNMFNDYNKDGPLYVVQTPDKRKYQFHFQSNQFMNENDEQINVGELFKKHPELHDVKEFHGDHVPSSFPTYNYKNFGPVRDLIKSWNTTELHNMIAHPDFTKKDHDEIWKNDVYRIYLLDSPHLDHDNLKELDAHIKDTVSKYEIFHTRFYSTNNPKIHDMIMNHASKHAADPHFYFNEILNYSRSTAPKMMYNYPDVVKNSKNRLQETIMMGLTKDGDIEHYINHFSHDRYQDSYAKNLLFQAAQSEKTKDAVLSKYPVHPYERSISGYDKHVRHFFDKPEEHDSHIGQLVLNKNISPELKSMAIDHYVSRYRDGMENADENADDEELSWFEQQHKNIVKQIIKHGNKDQLHKLFKSSRISDPKDLIDLHDKLGFNGEENLKKYEHDNAERMRSAILSSPKFEHMRLFPDIIKSGPSRLNLAYHYISKAHEDGDITNEDRLRLHYNHFLTLKHVVPHGKYSGPLHEISDIVDALHEENPTPNSKRIRDNIDTHMIKHADFSHLNNNREKYSPEQHHMLWDRIKQEYPDVHKVSKIYDMHYIMAHIGRTTDDTNLANEIYDKGNSGIKEAVVGNSKIKHDVKKYVDSVDDVVLGAAIRHHKDSHDLLKDHPNQDIRVYVAMHSSNKNILTHISNDASEYVAYEAKKRLERLK